MTDQLEQMSDAELVFMPHQTSTDPIPTGSTVYRRFSCGCESGCWECDMTGKVLGYVGKVISSHTVRITYDH